MTNSHISQAKKCVTFIYKKVNKNDLVPIGTGFFIYVPVEKNNETGITYLVTAKHVIQDELGKLSSSVIMRLNTHDGAVQADEIILSDKIPVFAHPDNDVDIAIIPYMPDRRTYEFLMIPQDMITSQQMIKSLKISQGDEVFFTGLFTGHTGQKRIEPIVRFGKVALIPNEKIQWNEKNKLPKFLDLYLIECQAFGGNSGSPIFFQLNVNRDNEGIKVGGSPQFYLAGLVSGNFNAWSEIDGLEANPIPTSSENLGIAAITPAFKLLELLSSEEVKSHRNKPWS